MKLLASALLAGAATAAVAPQQHVMGMDQQPMKEVAAEPLIETVPETVFETVSSPFNQLKDIMKGLSAEVQAAWDEVAMMFPDDMAAASLFSMPKKHTRRPDHEWNHIVRGKSIQDVWVTNAEGEKEREIDGKLDTYDLRVKKVDPSELGVDPGVKQYSGYLDDNENDKHLFYCMYHSLLQLTEYLQHDRVLRITK